MKLTTRNKTAHQTKVEAILSRAPQVHGLLHPLTPGALAQGIPEDWLHVPRDHPIKIPGLNARPAGVSAVNARLFDEADALLNIFQSVLKGISPNLVAPDVLRTLQTAALQIVVQEFHNEFGTDAGLLGLTLEKLASMSPPPKASAALVAAHKSGRSLKDQQCDALSLILNTFLDEGGKDALLRTEALRKLVDMGRIQDLEAVLPSARKGTGEEVTLALRAVTAITQREGVPVERGGLDQDEVVGPLLKKNLEALTQEERTQIIEAVLDQGEITQCNRLGGNTNTHDVWMVTFKERLGANGHHIHAVFKPESETLGPAGVAAFSREVAVYCGVEQFLKTGLVTPTVETILAVPGQAGGRLGSIQYKIPDSFQLGSTDTNIDIHQRTFFINPRFQKFLNSPSGQEQLCAIRVVCFVAGCTDHFMNMSGEGGNPIWNHNNFLVVLDQETLGRLAARNRTSVEGLVDKSNQGELSRGDEEELFSRMRLRPIDFGNALGVIPAVVERGILPQHIHGADAQKAASLPLEKLASVLSPMERSEDTHNLAARLDLVAHRGKLR